MSHPAITKLVIIGVGLIGGSVALALRQQAYARHICGAQVGGRSLDTALRLGIIDSRQPLEQAVQDADFVLIATPVGQIPALLTQLSGKIPPQCVVSDAGSTKADVAQATRAHFGAHLSAFVPAHPIAGAEKSGCAAARADLFQQKKVVLTPLPETSPHAVIRVTELWQQCGAVVSTMDAETHDATLALMSHLPHVLAFALVHDIAQRPDAARLFDFAAGGFRDFSRIASSSPEMWRDICLANQSALLQELQGYQDELARIMQLIEAQDAQGLMALFQRARDARNQWINQYP